MKAHVAFQRSLAEQLAATCAASTGVCADDADALHAWRVAVRRLRTLLRALPKKSAQIIHAASLQDEWCVWSQRLGPARDADVWHETLLDPVLRRALGATVEGRSFLHEQRLRRQTLKADLPRLLQSAQYTRLLRRTERMLEHDLPPQLSTIGAARLARSARLAFAHLLVRAQRRARHLAKHDTEANVHALRRQIRRAHYLSEVGWKIASPKLRKRLWQVQTALGDVHDADVQLTLLVSLSPILACRVRSRILRQRKEALRRFRKRWHALSRQL